MHPGVTSGREFPNLIGRRCVDPESAENIELVIEDSKATRKSYPVGVTRPGSGNAFNHVGERVITKHAISGRGLSACRAAYTVDVRCARVVEHAASHVADLVVRKRGGLDSPTIGGRIVFKRVREIVAGSIHAAPAYRVKLSKGWKVDANHADSGTWHVGSR